METIEKNETFEALVLFFQNGQREFYYLEHYLSLRDIMSAEKGGNVIVSVPSFIMN